MQPSRSRLLALPGSASGAVVSEDQFLRLILGSLNELGFKKAADALQQDSGVRLDGSTSSFETLKAHIEAGRWDSALNLLAKGGSHNPFRSDQDRIVVLLAVATEAFVEGCLASAAAVKATPPLIYLEEVIVPLVLALRKRTSQPPQPPRAGGIIVPLFSALSSYFGNESSAPLFSPLLVGIDGVSAPSEHDLLGSAAAGAGSGSGGKLLWGVVNPLGEQHQPRQGGLRSPSLTLTEAVIASLASCRFHLPDLEGKGEEDAGAAAEGHQDQNEDEPNADDLGDDGGSRRPKKRRKLKARSEEEDEGGEEEQGEIAARASAVLTPFGSVSLAHFPSSDPKSATATAAAATTALPFNESEAELLCWHVTHGRLALSTDPSKSSSGLEALWSDCDWPLALVNLLLLSAGGATSEEMEGGNCEEQKRGREHAVLTFLGRCTDLSFRGGRKEASGGSIKNEEEKEEEKEDGEEGDEQGEEEDGFGASASSLSSASASSTSASAASARWLTPASFAVVKLRREQLLAMLSRRAGEGIVPPQRLLTLLGQAVDHQRRQQQQQLTPQQQATNRISGSSSVSDAAAEATTQQPHGRALALGPLAAGMTRERPCSLLHDNLSPLPAPLFGRQRNGRAPSPEGSNDNGTLGSHGLHATLQPRFLTTLSAKTFAAPPQPHADTSSPPDLAALVKRAMAGSTSIGAFQAWKAVPFAPPPAETRMRATSAPFVTAGIAVVLSDGTVSVKAAFHSTAERKNEAGKAVSTAPGYSLISAVDGFKKVKELRKKLKTGEGRDRAASAEGAGVGGATAPESSEAISSGVDDSRQTADERGPYQPLDSGLTDADDDEQEAEDDESEVEALEGEEDEREDEDEEEDENEDDDGQAPVAALPAAARQSVGVRMASIDNKGLLRLGDLPSSATDACFSPCGRFLITVSDRSRHALLWSLFDLEEAASQTTGSTAASSQAGVFAPRLAAFIRVGGSRNNDGGITGLCCCGTGAESFAALFAPARGGLWLCHVRQGSAGAASSWRRNPVRLKARRVVATAPVLSLSSRYEAVTAERAEEGSGKASEEAVKAWRFDIVVLCAAGSVAEGPSLQQIAFTIPSLRATVSSPPVRFLSSLLPDGRPACTGVVLPPAPFPANCSLVSCLARPMHPLRPPGVTPHRIAALERAGMELGVAVPGVSEDKAKLTSALLSAAHTAPAVFLKDGDNEQQSKRQGHGGGGQSHAAQVDPPGLPLGLAAVLARAASSKIEEAKKQTKQAEPGSRGANNLAVLHEKMRRRFGVPSLLAPAHPSTAPPTGHASRVLLADRPSGKKKPGEEPADPLLPLIATLLLVNLGDGSVEQLFVGHLNKKEVIRPVCFALGDSVYEPHPPAPLVACGSEDGAAYLWSATTGELDARLEPPPPLSVSGGLAMRGSCNSLVVITREEAEALQLVGKSETKGEERTSSAILCCNDSGEMFVWGI